MPADPHDSHFDEETRALLQQRLWMVFGVLALLASFYAVSQFVEDLLRPTPVLPRLLDPFLALDFTDAEARARYVSRLLAPIYTHLERE